MTIPTWPTDLPKPLRSAWGEQRQDARRRRAADYGPQRYARRFTAVPVQQQLKLIIDHELEGVLDAFYREDLAEGALPFWMPDARRDGIPLLDEDGTPLLYEDDEPILCDRLMLCLWGDEPPLKAPIKGTEVEVSFSIWDLPQ